MITARQKKLLISIPTGVIGFIALSFLCSFTAGAVQALSLAYLLYTLIFLAGMAVLGVDAWWYLRFRSKRSAIIQSRKMITARKCPACGSELHINQVVEQNKIGFPSARFAATCQWCRLIAVSQFPEMQWTFRGYDREKFPEFAWLYGDAVLTTDELNLIASGKHTPRAKEKIRARALAEIASGCIERLQSFDLSLLKAREKGVQVGLLPGTSTPIRLKKDEVLVLVASPLTFGELRTKQGKRTITPLDKGTFFVTTTRYGFVGSKISLDKRISDITRLACKDAITEIGRLGRKRPEFIMGVDGEFVCAVLEGLGAQR